MKTAFRTLAAIVAGLAVAFVLVVAVELFSAVVHPVPEGFTGTQEEMCLHVERYPAWVLGVAVLLWGATALAAAWTARRIGNLFSLAIVGLLIMAALVLNISMLPYPLWFKLGTLVVIPAAILAGGRIATPRQPTGLVVAA